MKKALISKNEQQRYVSSWELDTEKNIYNPIFTYIGNRICDVEDKEFDVHPAFFWIDSDDINKDKYYYDISDNSIKLIPDDAIAPELPSAALDSTQPTTTGTQTI